MKNLHLISTEKPSRLFNCFGKLEIGDYTTIRENLQVTNQHIYITSDEKLPYDDSIFNTGAFYHRDAAGDVHIITKDTHHPNPNFCSRIILTTDPYLIARGVQAVDDNFLEWFVKNPSCESVEVHELRLFNPDTNESGHCKWELIIPKEEDKQFVECKCTNSLQAENCIRNCGHGKEPKQETHICKYCNAETTQSDDECYAKPKTLDEAAENYAEGKSSSSVFQEAHKKDFIEGYNYAKETMYSQEEVLKQLNHLIRTPSSKLDKYTDDGEMLTMKWFEQFKKK